MTELKITQADRDAFASVYDATAPAYAAEIREGTYDGTLLAQAFARHRIAAEEGKAELVEALENAIALIAHKMGMDTTAMVAGQTLVARGVWKQGMAALARVRVEG